MSVHWYGTHEPMPEELRLWIADLLYERESVLNDINGEVDWVRVMNVVAREMARIGYEVVRVRPAAEEPEIPA